MMEAILDTFDAVPWYAWGLMSLSLALVFLFEASYRRVQELEEELRKLRGQ